MEGYEKNVKKEVKYATNSYFLIPLCVNLWHFKLRVFDLKELIFWNI